MTELESDILATILAYLRIRGITHWRVPLSGLFNQGRKTKNSMKGHPDVAGLLPGGRYFAIEVKRPKGARWSEEQHEWRAKLEGAGALYLVATSVGDVERGLEAS